MKKIQFLFALLFIFTMFSCDSEQAEIQQELLDQNLEPSIEQQISDVHAIFIELRKDDPTVSLELKIVEGKLVSEITKKAENIQDGVYTIEDEPACKGDGYSFAKCVKDLVDKHGCIKITTCVYCADPC